MALRKPGKVGSVELPDAYHRIDRLNYNGGSVFIAVGSYAGKPDVDAIEKPYKTTELTTTMEELGATKTSLSFEKAYAAVKAHEDFEDATDDN